MIYFNSNLWKYIAQFLFELQQMPFQPGVAFVDFVQPSDVLILMKQLLVLLQLKG